MLPLNNLSQNGIELEIVNNVDGERKTLFKILFQSSLLFAPEFTVNVVLSEQPRKFWQRLKTTKYDK